MQSLASPSTSYAAPAVISLGEEYTDDMLSSEPTPTYDNGYYYSSSSESEQSEEEESEEDEFEPRHHHRRSSIAPSLWQAEHARLLSLQTAVLDNERAAWTREKRLESEVARIKSHLARLQKTQQQTTPPQTLPLESPSRLLASNNGASATSPPSSSTQFPPRCAGPRGPRPKPQQQHQLQQKSRPANDSSAPLLPKFSFESLKSNEPKPEEQAVSVLSIHLTEARSLRAQERQRRRNENERLRELATLLTLGSEVRKWEERLAWSQIQSNTRAAASDDSHLNKETIAKASNDTDVDPRGKRLSRSSSLPSNRMSYLPPPQQPQSTTKPPLSPALPSLALSPLWKVSAEMILRRRQLSERPRRTPAAVPSKPPVIATPEPTPAAAAPAKVVPVLPVNSNQTSTLARPAHTLRGPREKRTVSSTGASTGSPSPMTVSPTLTAPNGGTSSATTSSLSAKRNSIPPPISIPPSRPFCSTAAAAVPASNSRLGVPINSPSGTCSFFISKTTPVKPSALKWAFTAADLAREMQEEAAAAAQAASATAKAAAAATACCSEESSEGESGSDDSCKSSSDGRNSSSSSGHDSSPSSGNVERRGRARFSWRKSIPKEGTTVGSTILETPPSLPIPSATIER